MFEDRREWIGVQMKNLDEGMSSCESITGKPQDSNNAPSELNGDYLPQIENYTGRLFGLVSDLKSLSDSACIAALSKAESAPGVEESLVSTIITLRNQLDERDEDLQAKDAALKRLDTRWRATCERLEDCMRKKDAQLATANGDLKVARAAAQDLTTRLNDAELAMQHSESQRRQVTQRFEAEMAVLKLQLLSPTVCFEQKEMSSREAERELRVDLEHHRIRLNEAKAKLTAAETELERKRDMIEAAALRESEICKLMDRLSWECEQLTTDLQEKIALITSLKGKSHDGPDAGKMGKRVLELVQEQPL
jgi:chromosome segregation ATPase